METKELAKVDEDPPIFLEVKPVEDFEEEMNSLRKQISLCCCETEAMMKEIFS